MMVSCQRLVTIFCFVGGGGGGGGGERDYGQCIFD